MQKQNADAPLNYEFQPFFPFFIKAVARNGHLKFCFYFHTSAAGYLSQKSKLHLINKGKTDYELEFPDLTTASDVSSKPTACHAQTVFLQPEDALTLATGGNITRQIKPTGRSFHCIQRLLSCFIGVSPIQPPDGFASLAAQPHQKQ